MQQSTANRELYEQMVNDYTDDLYRYAYRQCGDAHTAEDLVGEAYFEAWKSIHNLREEKKARAWLFQILRFRFAHYLRDKGRRIQPRVSLDKVENTLSAPAPEVLENLSRRELLQRALDGLEERYREPFLMVFLEGLSCKETAKKLAIPLGTVLSRIHRARGFLREELRELENEVIPVSLKKQGQSASEKPRNRLQDYQDTSKN